MSKSTRSVTRHRKDKAPAGQPATPNASAAARPAARPVGTRSHGTARPDHHQPSGQDRDRQRQRDEQSRARGPVPQGPPKNLVDEQALNDLASMDADAFAAAMGGVMQGERKRFSNGDRVSGKVVGESERFWFLDVGGKAEAVFSKEELPTAELGQILEGFVMGRDEMGLRVGTKLTGEGAKAHLADAAESGIPLEGKVIARNAGGFTIEVAGTKAFCPVSHIDLSSGGDLDRFVGKAVTVKVLELRGKDLVVSVRNYLQEQRAEQAESQWATLQEGDSLTGTVRNVQTFGAFVDLGGVDGLVPRSELSWDRNAKVEDLVSVGQQVEVTIISLDRDAKKLTLSLKDPAASPWSKVGSDFQVGGSYTGEVVRITDFGAFVRLAAGLDGLVHISALSEERVEAVEDVVKKGQKVQVRILSVDRDAKRLELSMKAGGGPAGGRGSKQSSAGTASLGTFADLFAKAKK